MSFFLHLFSQVVRRLEASGLKLSRLRVPDVEEQDFVVLINAAASRTVDIVDKCIQKFGREEVLY